MISESRFARLKPQQSPLCFATFGGAPALDVRFRLLPQPLAHGERARGSRLTGPRLAQEGMSGRRGFLRHMNGHVRGGTPTGQPTPQTTDRGAPAPRRLGFIVGVDCRSGSRRRFFAKAGGGRAGSYDVGGRLDRLGGPRQRGERFGAYGVHVLAGAPLGVTRGLATTG